MVNVKNLFGMAVMATALVGCASNDDITPTVTIMKVTRLVLRMLHLRLICLQ